jgi:hypothetical protein
MVTVTDLQKLVSEYLFRSIDHKTLTARFTRIFHNLENTGDESAINLARTLRTVIGEGVAGLICEDDFRFALAASLTNIQIFSTPPVSTFELMKEEEDPPSSPYKRAKVVFA